MLAVEWVGAERIHPNPWNPNEMTPAMFEKERASIREFGFIDPITARRDGTTYQVIDGEQRFNAGIAEGLEEFPVIVLDVTEDEAKELTIILNDTRGQFREDRLSDLLRDLSQRREQARLEAILPYDRPRLEQLTGRKSIDWDDLEKRRHEMKRDKRDVSVWVERVFRMPKDAAATVDAAVERVQNDEGFEQPWQALEMIAADYLAGPGGNHAEGDDEA
jgi:hypothetical protein